MFTLKQRHLLIWKLKQKVEASKNFGRPIIVELSEKDRNTNFGSCQQGQIMNSNVRLITECLNGRIV